MPKFELFGTAELPVHAAKCASGWNGEAATSSNTTSMPIPTRCARMLAATGGQRTVPVLIEDGKVTQIGWQGRGCVVGKATVMQRAIRSRARRGARRGFRPFVFRLARANALAGWVLNEPDGVDIHLEGAEAALETFLSRSGSAGSRRPRASRRWRCSPDRTRRPQEFRHSRKPASRTRLSVRISPDLPVCDDCLTELFDPAKPALPLSVYQLHQLRPALHRDRAPSLRSAEHHHASIGRWTHSARSQYRRSGRPPLSRAACGLSELRAALFAGSADEPSHGDHASIARRPSNFCTPDISSPIKGHRRLSSGLRCPQCAARSRRCANGNSARRSRSR